ncbi:transposase InsO family protein [Kitasatospora sp. GP30]|nr:transposase InsO family protein [Kitasatospora sp. GP30]
MLTDSVATSTTSSAKSVPATLSNFAASTIGSQTRTERRIINVRVLRRWGPARIAFLLRLNPATVHRLLTRYRLARLAHLDRATSRPIRRYEHSAPGDLIHVDIKKLGTITDGDGHRVLGRQPVARHFTRAGITVRRVMTDNGSYKRTRPYRPQTNGKVERFKCATRRSVVSPT